MPETFLILFAGGIMLAAAISDPRQVTLPWLRLAGIIALSLAALSAFFAVRDGAGNSLDVKLAYAAALTAVLGQLAFVQIVYLRTQRGLALAAYLATLAVAGALLPPQLPRDATIMAALAGTAAVTGLALMDMLLGHAYLTASQMTSRPFARLNLSLAAALALRAITSGGLAIWMQTRQNAYLFWRHFGVMIATRYLVGFLVPAVFIYMAHDCIKRRSNQAATGILYVTGILLMIGELTGLWLVRQTGLPF